MSSQLQPSGSPVDKIDHLLRAFFRAEVPDPWPAAPTPEIVSRPLPARRRDSLWRSRLALAASIALLLIGQWLLAGFFTGAPTRSPDAPSDGQAKRHVLPADPMDLPPGPMPERNHR